MDEARLKILKMLEDGKITAEEAAKLLEALDKSSKASAETEGNQWTRRKDRSRSWFGLGDLMFEVGEIVREAVTAALSVVPAAIQGATQGGMEVDEEVEVPEGATIRLSLSAGDADFIGTDSSRLSLKGECVPGGFSIKQSENLIEVKMTGGDFSGSVPISSPLELNISAGDLDFRGAGGRARVNVSAGDCDLHLVKVEDVDVAVSGGDLTLYVPRNADFTAEIAVKMGDFSVPESENVTMTRSGGKTIVRFGTGTGGKLRATVKMGDLSIRFE